jgi:hypothetical protein
VFARAVVVKDLVFAGQLNPEDLPDKIFHLAATVPLKPEAGKVPFDRDELLSQLGK